MENGLNNPSPFTIFLIFSAGLLTSLGPCSLSLLPVTIAYIGGTEKNKFKLISFSGGVVFSLVALGATSGFLGKIYGQIPSYYTSFVALISIIHIAVATGSMPTTGLPLPFISYGGNSLIASFFIAGMLVRCSLESTGFIGIISTRKTLN